MVKEFKDLLENEILGEDVKIALEEAFNSKVKAAEQKLQEDYAARYSNDKAKLVESMDKMLTDTIRAELAEFAEDRAAMLKQRARLSKQISETKAVYAKMLEKNASMLNEFVKKRLHAEVEELVNDRKSIKEQRREMASQVQQIRESSESNLKARIEKLEGFVIKQLSEELAEFHADKRALVEQRVKLLSEGKKKITETQQRFIQRATKTIDKTLNEVIKSELVQWRDDIKIARENNFGRKIFEAMASEYMASYLSEGSEVKKLMTELQKQKTALAEAKMQLAEKQKIVESAAVKINAANDRVVRMQTLSELLAPLPRDKKTIMEGLLKDIKTPALKDAYSRYLPAVVGNNGVAGAATSQKSMISENSTLVSRNGNRDNNLTKAVIEETKTPDDFGVILHLAGIKN